MRVNYYLLPVIAIAALLGAAIIANALGIWSTSGRTVTDLVSLTPEEIKGWMTLQQVIDGVGIGQSDLYGLMNIPPEVPANTALKELEGIVLDFEVTVLRERLTVYLQE